jgi:hypothetical protein
VHLNSAVALHRDASEVIEQLGRAGVTGVAFLTRRCGRRQQGVVQQWVGIGATAEADTDNGRGTLGIVVDQVASTSARRPLMACSEGAWKWYCASS